MIKGWKNAHSDIASIRRAAGAAALPFVVRSVNKDGSVSKARPNPAYDYFATRDGAEKRVGELAKMNPGSRFVVCDNV